MKKFFLNPFLAGEELDVINQEHIGLPIFFAKLDERIILDRVDVFVGKFLGRNVSDARAFFVRGNMLTDGMKQMSFAETDATIEEQGIGRFPGRFSDGFEGGVRKVIVVADNKHLKGVLGIEVPFAVWNAAV